MLLHSYEQCKKGAFDMMEEARAMAENAAKPNPQYPDISMLVDANQLQSDADKELSQALCMGKLIHGRCAQHAFHTYGACMAIFHSCRHRTLHVTQECVYHCYYFTVRL